MNADCHIDFITCPASSPAMQHDRRTLNIISLAHLPCLAFIRDSLWSYTNTPGTQECRSADDMVDATLLLRKDLLVGQQLLIINGGG